MLKPGDCVWLSGHSPTSGADGQLERQLEVLDAIPVPPPAIALHFRVPSYKKRNWFDMESLGYVILASWRHHRPPPAPPMTELYRPRSIWLTMEKTSEEEKGMVLCHEPPAEPSAGTVRVDVVIANPPKSSIRGTNLPELAGHEELSDEPWLGLDLTFGQEVDIGEFGFDGPVKGLIDAMYPVLGGRSGHPADHRLHDLRIRRDVRDDGSVRARFWYSPELKSQPNRTG